MEQLSITQVAQKLGKSRQWIWFLIRTGQLKAQKVGNQFVVGADDLVQFNKTYNKQNSSEVRV